MGLVINRSQYQLNLLCDDSAQVIYTRAYVTKLHNVILWVRM